MVRADRLDRVCEEAEDQTHEEVRDLGSLEGRSGAERRGAMSRQLRESQEVFGGGAR